MSLKINKNYLPLIFLALGTTVFSGAFYFAYSKENSREKPEEVIKEEVELGSAGGDPVPVGSSPTPTETMTPTPTIRKTPTPTRRPTAAPTSTPTSAPTNTVTPTPTNLPENTATPTNTVTPTPSVTNTPTPGLTL